MSAMPPSAAHPVRHHTVDVDGVEVFYREAGPADGPKLLLLHGFPTSSHMFRDLIWRLADRYRVVAPDLPGFGRSGDPKANTFASLAETIGRFTELVGFDRFTVYVFDYGAPTGFRLALAHPERVVGVITQNGNAYEEGLSDGWDPIRAYWRDPSAANRAALRAMLGHDGVWFQYTHGVPEPDLVSPDGPTLDEHFLARPGNTDIQLDLFGDYRNNVALYPDFQAFFRTHRPRILAVWGRNDPFFLPPGAEAYRRDAPDAEVRFFDTGHFALETHAAEIAEAIRAFLG